MSLVTCHLLLVSCQLSPVTCHLSPIQPVMDTDLPPANSFTLYSRLTKTRPKNPDPNNPISHPKH